MGDHRASIKIQVSAHGVKDQCDMWINYYPDDGMYGPDIRIIEFFENWWKKARSKYDEEMDDWQEQKDKEERRKVYERLKEEFESDRED